MTTEAGRRLLDEAWDNFDAKPWGSLADHVDAIEAEARADVQGRLDLLIHVCQDIVRDAGTAKWPVNLDRLRMALDELGALEEEG